MQKIGCFVLAGLAACAGVTHKNLESDQDAEDLGIRYFGTSLYLLVHSDGKGGVKAKILELPDPTKLRSARPHSALSSLKVTMNFKNGTLAKADASADSTVVAKEIVAAAEKVAAIAAKTYFDKLDSEGHPVIPAPSLWKIVPGNDDILFYGEHNEDNIRINKAPKKKGSA